MLQIHHANILFIDNPVGTGYSYVENLNLLTTTNKEIADDLVTFTKEFYATHSEFAASPLIVFGESYGGKMNIEFVLELDKVLFFVMFFII
jgi:serine carboxypeptidase 1